MKVLIVEDNEENLLLLKDLLVFHGHEVIEARSGIEAVLSALAHRPDVVFMDIRMPAMDGFEARRIIKNHPQVGKARIIALTAFALEKKKEKILEAGFDGYMTKPIDTRALPDVLKACGTDGRKDFPSDASR